MLNLDFTKIRSFDGSQDNGFEELICQLAHLKKPKDANYFVRKEGAGGDAGVECYWKLLYGTEHAWQAKYFPNRLEDEQWNQISKSVATALEKHPQLTKYYVCLPRDWTDSRKVSKSGKPVHSAWMKWEELVKKWTLLAESKGMAVEFLYWCKHDISLMLQTDDPQFAGRALYWFNEPVIQPQLLKNIALNSRTSLGERFTPENHLDLPIAEQFDGLGLTPEWKKRLREKRIIIVNQIKKLDTEFFANNNFKKKETCWTDLYKELENLSNEFLILIEHETPLNNFKSLQSIYSTIEVLLDTCNTTILNILENETDTKLKKQWRDFNSTFRQLKDKLDEIKTFLFGKAVQAMMSKAAVLLGEAGIGKSHLLCDIALKRLDASLPTLFLLGQRYSGGNPLNFILDQLDIRGVSYSKVLGALDAAGEAKNTRTLIIIDAINEGNYRDEWMDHISSFLSEIANYHHLSIILSCRSTYVDYILPELTEDILTSVYHPGFRGFEHRAAMKYLANQGISKPSVPITSPEFSNPLFLKTCCKAIKLNGYTSFPKGLYGQSKLFDFYLESVDKIITRKKKYLPGQRVVQNALNEFIQLLYPDNLFGITVPQATKVVNEHDTNPHHGDTLISLLIDEGLLSLDIITEHDSKRVKEVVRFTYERFSDHSIAQYIISQINQEDIASHFKEDGSIGKLINKGLSKSGLIEAIGIGFPEKFKMEFIDFIPEDFTYYNWLFSTSFTDVLQWRAKESFTKRTTELLNKINSNGAYKKSIDKLLSLSTEPEHPWNADFLDRNLRRMKLAERDAFWSTHIAVSDWEEDEDQAESAVRTIIDWSLLANLNEVETERLRLTAITLLWMTTTTNRRVRDQSTKSLAKILSFAPQLIQNLIREYNNIDDPYLVERLFAAIFGGVCNIDNEKEIKELAQIVFEYVFRDEKPYPHILIRDYARGVLELAFYKGMLPEAISTEDFRPPYNSEWPINNPSQEEISNSIGDDSSSAILRSVSGILGDFGKYVMGCVHNWSPTPLSERKPESSYEIHLKLANTLPDDLKSRYIAIIKKKSDNSRTEHFNISDFLETIKSMGENYNDDKEEVVDEWEVLKEEVKATLDDNQKEYFRWVCGQGINDKPAKFSRKWAQRWVCKRAHELGWKSSLFASFERIYTQNYDRSPSRIERIGKKYQWIAFHELLAYMSDNLYWIDRCYSDIDDSEFRGPWQIHLRDLDPTLWLRETGDSGWDEFEHTWWQPFTFPFVEDNLEHQKSWLWDRTIVPSFENLIEVKNPYDDNKWVVLRGFSKWSKKPEQNENIIPTQDGWYRINTCIVDKNDVDSLRKELAGKNLCDPHVISPSSTGHQKFLKEYPWHPCYEELIDWINPKSEANWHDLIKVKYHIPTNTYEWESGSTDKSLNESISFNLPSKYLISELGLRLKQYEYGEWVDTNGTNAFLDPSNKEKGPSYALVRSELLIEWLEENNLKLIWLIGGEKQLFTSMANRFIGRLVYSGIYTLSDTGIEGNMWFMEEQGEN
ncbi:AVAST type 2 anti-phage system protein Avs2 [Cytobacillus sp. BC1816]|uniref:AVAST type 2 anti-phage system protein Avs2 n=1 Tax=Cytobacillus sp. BC1816 TaxID=3440154 RepID=UPI003F50D9D3